VEENVGRYIMRNMKDDHEAWIGILGKIYVKGNRARLLKHKPSSSTLQTQGCDVVQEVQRISVPRVSKWVKKIWGWNLGSADGSLTEI
jgi:hypothetical protein